MLLQMPPEVRLIVYQIALIDDTSIPFTNVLINKRSLLSTCRRFREEGTPIFYAQNNFTVTTPDHTTLSRLRRQLGQNSRFIRNLIINFDLGAMAYVDQLWNLSKISHAMQPTCVEFLGQFPDLQSLSIQITTPHHCTQHSTQLEEVLCASFRAGCVEESGNIYAQLTKFGEVCTSTTRDDGAGVSTTMTTLHPKIMGSSCLAAPLHPGPRDA